MRVAAFGLREKASQTSLEDALARAGGGAGVTHLAVLADKAAHPALAALVARLGLPLRALPRENIAGIATRTHSCRIEKGFETGSVAEALALVAAGAGAALAAPRATSDDGMATCAIAEIPCAQGGKA